MTTIDFRRTRWGHNLDIASGEDGKMRGFCWSTPGPMVGDTFIWRTAHGEARAIVEAAEWTANVDDMYSVVLEVVERSRVKKDS